MKQHIEPGLLGIFRVFTGVAMGYFAILVVYTAIETGQVYEISQIQSYLNLGVNLALFGYLSWPWLYRKMGRLYLPVALVAATVVPIFSNLIYLAEPEQKELAVLIDRSWLLLPILVVPLVLIAWQYRYRYVILFIVFSALVELTLLFSVLGRVDFETLPVLGVPLIRAFAFGTVGYIVNQLVYTQREQRRELIRANIKLSQHAETLEELATSRERNRLARELHDTLAHTLSGLAVNLEAIKLSLPDGHPEVQEMLDHSLRNTRAGLVETRRAMKDLRAKRLEDLGLSLALRRLAYDAAERAGFDLALRVEKPTSELPPEVEQSIYRIAQEALENIVQHAEARQVRLELAVSADTLCLEISDDGRGIDLSAVDPVERLGIRGMQERADMVGGELQITRQPSQGSRVRFSVEVWDDQSVDL